MSELKELLKDLTVLRMTCEAMAKVYRDSKSDYIRGMKSVYNLMTEKLSKLEIIYKVKYGTENVKTEGDRVPSEHQR